MNKRSGTTDTATKRRRLLGAMLAGAWTLGAGPAAAQATGNQTLKLIVGYPAGGPVDAAARLYGQVLGRELGMTVMVENRPGAAGTIAVNSVAKARPNSLEVFFAASPTLTISPHVIKPLNYDTFKDLLPMAPILTYTNVLVVNASLPIKSVAELTAYAKANPHKLMYGSAGMGSSNHLSGELFARRAGVSMTHVPYKGNAMSMNDVIGGQIQMMFDIVGGAKPFIESGKVRALAVTSKERNPTLPQVPSLMELGVRDIDISNWYGLFGPVNTTPDVRKRIEESSVRALQDAELRKRWTEQGYQIWNAKPADMAERMRSEYVLWGEVTRGMVFE